jgi:hypothetical protein
VVLESYRYAPGPATRDDKHSHEEYQFCLSLDFPGEYRYCGGRHPMPVGSLSVIHSGEVHSSRDPHDRETTANYRLMYVEPDTLARAASEVAGRLAGTAGHFCSFRAVVRGRDTDVCYCELPRITLPRTRVNTGKEKGQSP